MTDVLGRLATTEWVYTDLGARPAGSIAWSLVGICRQSADRHLVGLGEYWRRGVVWCGGVWW